jgi:hypothetical protein
VRRCTIAGNWLGRDSSSAPPIGGQDDVHEANSRTEALPTGVITSVGLAKLNDKIPAELRDFDNRLVLYSHPISLQVLPNLIKINCSSGYFSWVGLLEVF